MSTIQSFDAFQAYLQAEWTGAPLVFENDPESGDLPDTPAALIVVEVFGSFYAQESFGAPGSNLWRESGQTYFHVLTLRGSGSRAGRQIVTDLANLFRERSPEGVRITDMAIGAGEPGEQDGNYFRTTLTVNWQHDS